MLLAALRRFLVVTVSVAGATGALALLLGAALGASAARSTSLGFYCVGAFALVVGVFVGSRGPVRMKSEDAGPLWMPFLFVGGNRRFRWATLGEQNETINNSAVFVAVGVLLLIFGILIDPHHKLF